MMADHVPGGMGAITDGFGSGSSTGSGSKRTGRPTKGGAWTQLGTGVAVGAASGAAVGLPFAGVGAIVGAVVGAVVGAIPGAIALGKSYGGGSTHAQRMAKFESALVSAQQMSLPDAAFALRDAQAVLNEFQALSEQANQMESSEAIEVVYEIAEPAEQALSDAGNDLADTLSVYQMGQNNLDPWNLNNPSLQALREMPQKTLAVKNALFAAQQGVADFRAVLADPRTAYQVVLRGPVAEPLPPATFPSQGILRGWARIGPNSIEARTIKGAVAPDGTRIEYDGPPVGYAPSLEEWAQFDARRERAASMAQAVPG